MHVLDDIGDDSDANIRKQHFQEADRDGSGTIDFEEFLGVKYHGSCPLNKNCPALSSSSKAETRSRYLGFPQGTIE